jgi:hypothetical protein
LKGAALACFVQSGEADLRHLAGVGPFGGDLLGALRRLAVHQHHVGMLGVDLIELGPDQVVIVEVEPAGDGDLRTRRAAAPRSRRALGGEEVAAVDHRRGQLRWLTIDPLRGRQGLIRWRS